MIFRVIQNYDIRQKPTGALFFSPRPLVTCGNRHRGAGTTEDFCRIVCQRFKWGHSKVVHQFLLCHFFNNHPAAGTLTLGCSPAAGAPLLKHACSVWLAVTAKQISFLKCKSSADSLAGTIWTACLQYATETLFFFPNPFSIERRFLHS